MLGNIVVQMAITRIYSKLVQYPVAGEKQSVSYNTLHWCLTVWVWMPYPMSEIIWIECVQRIGGTKILVHEIIKF